MGNLRERLERRKAYDKKPHSCYQPYRCDVLRLARILQLMLLCKYPPLLLSPPMPNHQNISRGPSSDIRIMNVFLFTSNATIRLSNPHYRAHSPQDAAISDMFSLKLAASMDVIDAEMARCRSLRIPMQMQDSIAVAKATSYARLLLEFEAVSAAQGLVERSIVFNFAQSIEGGSQGTSNWISSSQTLPFRELPQVDPSGRWLRLF